MTLDAEAVLRQDDFEAPLTLLAQHSRVIEALDRKITMGLDERIMSLRSLEVLPDRLREAGFDVDVTHELCSKDPRYTITVLKCRRGVDSQVLTWSPDPERSDECEVYIVNAWAWLSHVHKRRSALQMDVTTIIEQNGGYSSFSERQT